MITKDSRTVLVADDSVFFRTKLSDILVEAGHKVRLVKDGRELIGELKIDSAGIDLLMLDLQMPDMDGFSVLDWLSRNGLKGRFPVLVITGAYEPGEVMEKLKSLGADGLMTKGLTPEQIIFRVNRLLFPDKVSVGRPRLRVPVSIPADFSVGEIVKTGYLLNLSETGAFLNTRTELLAGAVLKLRFSVPGSPGVLEARATVKWSTSDVSSKTLFGGYGVMFTSISDKDLAILREFISGESERLGLEKD
ncbi:MAG: response regulator [Candidatus Methylomirabilis sp.]|nr:response regulator [Deltaproteobacteria bacterium]